MQSISIKQQRGATLVEVLISMLIIMLGVLGAVGLKVASTRAVADSNFRSTAAIYAQDMLERMRANPTRAATGEYNFTPSTSLPSNTGTIAQQDLFQWYTRLGVDLPSGTATISVLGSVTASITMQWTERSAQSNTGQTMTFTFRSVL